MLILHKQLHADDFYIRDDDTLQIEDKCDK